MFEGGISPLIQDIISNQEVHEERKGLNHGEHREHGGVRKGIWG